MLIQNWVVSSRFGLVKIKNLWNHLGMLWTWAFEVLKILEVCQCNVTFGSLGIWVGSSWWKRARPSLHTDSSWIHRCMETDGTLCSTTVPLGCLIPKFFPHHPWIQRSWKQKPKCQIGYHFHDHRPKPFHRAFTGIDSLAVDLIAVIGNLGVRLQPFT